MIESHPVFRNFLIISLVILVASCGSSSSGGGSSSGDSFPTPTVPAGARTITALTADDTSESAVDFVTILSEFAQLKTESPPTMAQVVDRVIDQVIRRNRISRSRNASKTEDLSSTFCVSGSASADFDETPTSESGTITFTNCDISSGILVDGALVYANSWNDTTLDYNLQIGGTLALNFGPPLVTIVINLVESGNDGTGDFSTNINFSLAGIPDGGFLVTTTQNLVGNSFIGLASGQLIVTGSANSRLRLTIIGPSSASLDLDTGNGTFVSCATIMDCTSPIIF